MSPPTLSPARTCSSSARLIETDPVTWADMNSKECSVLSAASRLKIRKRSRWRRAGGGNKRAMNGVISSSRPTRLILALSGKRQHTVKRLQQKHLPSVAPFTLATCCASGGSPNNSAWALDYSETPLQEWHKREKWYDTWIATGGCFVYMSLTADGPQRARLPIPSTATLPSC